MFSKLNTDFYNFKRWGTNRNSSSFFDIFTDPTYLGFKIFFHGIGNNLVTDNIKDIDAGKLQDDIEKQVSGTKNSLSNKITKYSDDIWRNNPNSLNNNENVETINSDGLFGSENNENSALYFLKRIGDTARFEMLKSMIELIIKVNTETPYYFQNLSGLENAWTRDFSAPKVSGEITIDCLESIDFRITAIMDLYRKVAYDWNYTREILPDNLRHFSMSIKVFDYRNFTVYTKRGTLDLNPANYSRDALINEEFLGSDGLNDSNQINFDFGFCEFVPNESSGMFADISNAEPKQATQKLKITYRTVSESNIYRILNSLATLKKIPYIQDYLNAELKLVAGNQKNSPIDNNLGDFYSKLGSVGNTLAQRGANSAASLINRTVNSLFLGNVYGFSASTFNSDPEGIARRLASQQNNTEVNRPENIHTQSNPHNNKNNPGNIYE